SLREDSFGMYEPIHGSAPDISGQGKANPIAQILSLAMLLRHSLDLSAKADLIEKAVDKVLEKGFRTADICFGETSLVSTTEMGTLILKEIKELK
ncbi:MAG: isocitrate/isopropylmalate family dehydrogenase, partial [Actinomycetota bacterium]